MAARLTAYIVCAIVAVTVVAGLIVGAQRDDDGPIDLIVYNGRVFTADGSGAFAEAVAIRGNEIVRVGSNREIKRLRRRATIFIDAHGGAVLPGFNDSHLHFLAGGLALSHVNLLDATNPVQVQDAIRRYASANADAEWVIGRGWYYGAFPGGLPTRQLLDAVVPDRPAYMTCYDGHTAWVNTKALELAGITRRTPNPPNGVIVKDPVTGEPTGVLKESAQQLVARLLPETSRADRIEALRAAVAEAHRLGITSVQNASGSAAEFELYDELRRTGDLKVRVYSALSLRSGLAEFDEDDAATLDAVREKYGDDPLFRTGAVKLSVDGVIEAHTASMLAPYANRPARGELTIDPVELQRIVTLLDRRGWQVFVHAIGDGGIRAALDAFDAAARANPAPAQGRRHRVEHVETIDPADVPRFGRLGVVAAMQPYHGNPTPYQLDVWSANIGPERAARGWSYRPILEAGGRVAFGSDWPVVPLDPRLQLHMAVNRTTPQGSPAGGWQPDLRVPLEAAILASTRDAAYASFDEHRTGTLARGMLADLVILSGDIFSLPPERLLDAVVSVTIFDGKVVFSREEEIPTN